MKQLILINQRQPQLLQKILVIYNLKPYLLRILELWTTFFKACDIPLKYAGAYAQSFSEERIQPFLLKDFNKDDLAELGVKAYGDKVYIF